MNVKRLLRLADHLDGVPVARFDIHDWACGTTACAIGHACFVTEFMADGLFMDFRPVDGVVYDGPEPAFGNLKGWEAVEEFFDL
jgi:hypothetical protein